MKECIIIKVFTEKTILIDVLERSAGNPRPIVARPGETATISTDLYLDTGLKMLAVSECTEE